MLDIVLSSKRSIHDINQQQHLTEIVHKGNGVKEICIATACIDPQMPEYRCQCRSVQEQVGDQKAIATV